MSSLPSDLEILNILYGDAGSSATEIAIDSYRKRTLQVASGDHGDYRIHGFLSFHEEQDWERLVFEFAAWARLPISDENIIKGYILERFQNWCVEYRNAVFISPLSGLVEVHQSDLDNWFRLYTGQD